MLDLEHALYPCPIEGCSGHRRLTQAVCWHCFALAPVRLRRRVLEAYNAAVACVPADVGRCSRNLKALTHQVLLAVYRQREAAKS